MKKNVIGFGLKSKKTSREGNQIDHLWIRGNLTWSFSLYK